MTIDPDTTESAADRETLAQLERALPRVSPPPEMFDRILAEIRPNATVIPLRSGSRRRVVMPVVGAVAAVVAIAILALGGTGSAHPMHGRRSPARALRR